MEERIITKKDLKDKSLGYIEGGESKCYYDDEILMKIIKPSLLKDDREKIIRQLYSFNNNDIVTPLFAIKNNNKFIGYGMQYLKGYPSLADYFKNNVTSFEERKELMIRLSKVFDYFDQMNYAYYDIHSYNILYKNDDMKLIDLDGGVIKGFKNDKLDYDTALQLAKKNLAKYTLHTITGVSEYYFNSLRIYKKKSDVISFINSLPENVRKLYVYALNNDYNCLNNITPTLEEITKDIYDDTKEILKKRLRLY